MAVSDELEPLACTKNEDDDVRFASVASVDLCTDRMVSPPAYASSYAQDGWMSRSSSDHIFLSRKFSTGQTASMDAGEPLG